MNSERAQAYGRVTKLVEDLSGSKLHAAEQQIIRDAADSLFFCEDLSSDPEAQRALGEFEKLVDSMVENERFTPETAGRLQADVEGCGPLVPSAR